MSRTVVALLLAVGAAVMTIPASSQVVRAVHEWGTFTSIAGEGGSAVPWLPQTGPNDLPCFVERNRYESKVSLPGTVRMETPVLYFYTPHETTVNVTVRFRQGLITEWFPSARVTQGASGAIAMSRGFEGAIEWTNVAITPNAPEGFPTEGSSSHYYAARQTDAAPLEVASAQEKFLFYRGVGGFRPSLTAIVSEDGRVSVRNEDAGVGDAILFENHHGQIAFQEIHTTKHAMTFDPLMANDESALPAAELERLLVAYGLYAKEARAMVNTWRDSWFEEGTRIIYIVPRQTVDSILPLTIVPVPTDLVRVFVGRVEVVTPATLHEVEQALENRDRAALRKYGRFLRPVGARVLEHSSAADRPSLEALLESVYSSWSAPQAACK